MWWRSPFLIAAIAAAWGIVALMASQIRRRRRAALKRWWDSRPTRIRDEVSRPGFFPSTCPDCGVSLSSHERKAHLAPCGAPCLFAIRTNPLFTRIARSEMHVTGIGSLPGSCPHGCFKEKRTDASARSR